MKKRVSELSGAALYWAVAKCEGVSVGNSTQNSGFIETAWDKTTKWQNACEIYAPSIDWSQGGPIIEMEEIKIEPWNDDIPGLEWSAEGWRTYDRDGDVSTKSCNGATPLIAAMRCYVASKLGAEVEIPEALI